MSLKKEVDSVNAFNLWAAGIFLLLMALGVATVFRVQLVGLFHESPELDAFVAEIVDVRVPLLLTGELVDEVEPTRVFAVMLDNAPEAWPHYGLSKAEMVWEFPVEGGRTRLMAFFDEHTLFDDEQVGPVRSVRPYFLDIAKSFDAYVVHVGGAPQALDMIAQGYVRSMNEFFNAGYFWRDTTRYAPHNVMTDGLKLRDKSEKIGIADADFDGWIFGDIDVDEYTSPSFVFGELSVDWKFEDGRYVRYVHGRPFVDAAGVSVDAQNVIIVFTHMKTIDAALRREIVTVGEGEMIAFVGGKEIKGGWVRFQENDVMRFYDKDGEEIVMQRGKTWVEVLPNHWHINTSISQ